jgi:Predicted membrane protein (DUF2207)
VRKFAVVLLALLPAQGLPRVVDFHSDIRIARNGELSVTERITLEVDDRQPHSVLRRELRAPIVVADVIRNGHPEPWLLEPDGDGARLRIGKPGAALAHGRHTYQIAYRSQRQVRFLEAHDELHWRLGPAERITAEIVLPSTVPRREIRADAGKDAQSFVRDGRAAFRAMRAIAPHEEVMVVVRFPKNVVSEPKMDYRGLLAVLLLLVASAGVLLRLRRLAGNVCS